MAKLRSPKAAALLFFLLALPPARALANEDMFHSGNSTESSKTPWVTTEGPGRTDFFIHPNDALHQNMFLHAPNSNDPQGEDLFLGNAGPAPDNPLFHTPKNSDYR